MSASWLQRKRKGELLELAQQANLPDADGLLKDDLVEALHEHLEANETTYAKQSAFSDFYSKRNGSPIKRERSSPLDPTVAVAKPRRRQTISRVLNEDSEEATPDKALVTRTPRAVSSRAALARRVSEVDIPASPRDLANVADESFQAAKARASEIWKKSYVDEAIAIVRENASSVAAVQTLVLLIEAVGIQFNTLETMYAFDVPGSLKADKSIHLPDLTLLLTSGFWAPATLWSLTSWFLPLLVSYFFNLTLKSNTRHKSSSRAYTVDPLTFNIAKAILQYAAYPPTEVINPATGTDTVVLSGWGPFSSGTVTKVWSNAPGGYYGLQIGALVGILVSLYDAALKK